MKPQELLKKYISWRNQNDYDDSYHLDMIHEFFSEFKNRELLDFMEWVTAHLQENK